MRPEISKLKLMLHGLLKLLYTVVSVSALLVGALGSCKSKGDPLAPVPEGVAPWTLRNASLVGRPPEAFPSSATEQQIAVEMRAHLSGTLKTQPDAPLLAMVYLVRPISPDEWANLIRSYKMKGGPKAGVNFGDSDHGSGAITWPSTIDTADDILRSALDHYRQIGSPRASRLTAIEGFWGYSTAPNLLALWDENPGILRAVGVMGRADAVRPTPVPIWRSHLADEPLR